MGNLAIKIEDVSKLYELGTVGTGTLSRDLQRWWANMRGMEDPFMKIGQENDRTRRSDSNFMWALKDIDLTIAKGDVVGVIGRNGAGKSTLLKLLSKVTAPTTGKISIDGRIASLLEVGTGFHPEMTGRENIFMNGAILGMRKKEIRRKFDEIVQFAGVEAYINTPVKRYSSGMYVRLAFSVAAHLESEILIVDEVLAVGDAEFQSKCLGRMESVSKNEGRTILFVSHNMGAIRNLCSRGVVMNNGRIFSTGTVTDSIADYMRGNLSERAFLSKQSDPSKDMEFLDIRVVNKEGEVTGNILSGDAFELQAVVHVRRYRENATLSFRFTNQDGIPVLTTALDDYLGDYRLTQGEHTFRIRIDPNVLMPGKYEVLAAIFETKVQIYDLLEQAVSINIENYGTLYRDSDRKGVVAPVFPWEAVGSNINQ